MDPSIRPLTDTERELHITYCAGQIEDAMARFAVSNCFTDRGEADHWRLQMEQAIRGRSAAQVARMEQERGFV
jgi:hypothetical protein